MPDMSFLDQIANLNNEGCEKLVEGNYDEAMNIFKCALTHLKAEVLIHGNVLEKEENIACLTPLHLQSLRNNNIPFLVHHDENNRGGQRRDGAAVEEVEDDLNQYFIFSHAIPILNGHRFSSDEREGTKVYIAIVVFNLALILHLGSLKSGNRRSLTKAQSLYEKCFDVLAPIIKAYCCNGRATNNTVFDLLVMALLNNLALVYLELVDPIQSCAAFQLLANYASIVSFFRPRHKGRLGARRLTRHHDQVDDTAPSLSSRQDRTRSQWTTSSDEELDTERFEDNNHSFFQGEVDRMLLNFNLVKVAMASTPVAPAA